MTLKDRLAAEIAANGPMSIADFMSRCLFDPDFGYYATRPRLGAEGDFVTAPLVSQIFGELIGLWAVDAWMRLGSPDPFLFVEVGPGDGALFVDMATAASIRPAFRAAARPILVEPSGPLRSLQRARLDAKGVSASHVVSLGDVPADLPLILVANELLDCLPADQFMRTPEGWFEKRVGLDGEGGLQFGLVPASPPPGVPVDAPPGHIWERSAAQTAFGAEVGARVAAQGGVALFIDYGRASPEAGDTLQALKDHRKVDPLQHPGEADLTVWADFPAFLAAARAAGAATSGPLEQGRWLLSLGAAERAAALARSAPDRADIVDRQLRRLVDPQEMGALFKVAAIHQKEAPPFAGFEGRDE